MRLNELESESQYLSSGTPTPHETEQLVAFFANAWPGRDLGGMVPPRAVWLAWNALHRVSKKPVFSLREQVVVQRLTEVYRSYYVSAVVNCFYRARPDLHKEYSALLRNNLLASVLRTNNPQPLDSGYIGHATVTRISVSHSATEETHSGPRWQAYTQSLQVALGTRARDTVARLHGKAIELRDVYHQDLTPRMLGRAFMQQLLTEQTCIVHPARQKGCVQLTYRLQGRVQSEVIGIDSLAVRVGALGRTPVANSVKVTLHNGGSGAQARQNGTTMSYDRRLLLPMCEAEDYLVLLQEAAVSDRLTAIRALGDAMVYNVADRASENASPSMSVQNLGNCTIHSQKLFLLYELQHLCESATPLGATAEAGTRLFAKIWPAMMEDVTSAYRKEADLTDPRIKVLLSRVAAALARAQRLEVPQKGLSRRGEVADSSRFMPPTFGRRHLPARGPYAQPLQR